MTSKMSWWICRVVVVLLAAIGATTAAETFSCAGMPSKFGTIVTKESDIVQEVGTSYNATCIFTSDLNVKKVHFVKKSGIEYHLQHTVLNDTAIQVTVREDEPINYSLECKADEVRTICFKSVRFGYPPQDVQNFSCISRNWQQLNCSWIAPKNPVEVTYALTYVLPGRVTQSPCPDNSKHTNKKKISWCHWASNTIPQFNPRKLYNFTINATNALGYRVYYRKNYNIEEIVLPNSVIEMVVSVDGTNSLKASWKLPHPMDVFPGGVRHQVIVEINGTRELIKNEIKETSKSDMSVGKIYHMDLDVPYAYIDYRVQIRIHTGKGTIRENMWSEPAIVINRTKPMVPEVSPNPNVTGFEVMNDMSYRSIYITWQEIDPLQKAGPNFEYAIEVYKSGEDEPLNVSPVVLTSSYAKFTKMDFFEYRFDIYATNSEGRGKEKTSIIVPEKSKLLHGMSFFTAIVYEDSFGKKIYELSWKPPKPKKNQEKISSYKLYWCRKTPYESRCENNLHSETILDTTLMEYNLTGLEYEDYMFGIAAYSPTSSTGIKWAACVVKYNEARPAMQNVAILEIKSRSVELGWELQCIDRAGVVVGFNISYCEGTKSDFGECRDGSVMHHQVMDESAEAYEIQGLHPNTSYLFSVAVLSRTVQSGWSRPKVAATKEDKPSGIPEILSVHTTNVSAELSWLPPRPEERNGLIRYYIYSYSYKEQKNEIDKNRVNNTGDVTKVVIKKLEPYQNYTVQVRACTIVGCSDVSAMRHIKTKIGVPGKIKHVYYDPVNRTFSWEFDNEDRNGPTKNIEIHVTFNQSNIVSKSLPGEHIFVTLDELDITCEGEERLRVAVRAVNEDEDGHILGGEWLEKEIICSVPVLSWWQILMISFVCVVVTVVVVYVGLCAWRECKRMRKEYNTNVKIPPALVQSNKIQFGDPNMNQTKTSNGKANGYGPLEHQISRISEDGDKKRHLSAETNTSAASEDEDLVLHGLGGESQQRGHNLSGDSSGCSTGSDSNSYTAGGSHQDPLSYDSGTVQEQENTFLVNRDWKPPSVRWRPTGALPNKPNDTPISYVAVGSVPSLLPDGSGGLGGVGLDEGENLQQSTPNLSSIVAIPGDESQLKDKRTSTGYISMPTSEMDSGGLAGILGNVPVLHDDLAGRVSFSRHDYPPKRNSLSDMGNYTKTGSLSWLNMGYVAVAQADGKGPPTPNLQPQHMPSASRGYVSVAQANAGDFMKRQPSLPTLVTKNLSSPDEERPPGAYCRVGTARASPPGFSRPSMPSTTGYVTVSEAPPGPILNQKDPVTLPVSTERSPYVTCAEVLRRTEPEAPSDLPNTCVPLEDIKSDSFSLTTPEPVAPTPTPASSKVEHGGGGGGGGSKGGGTGGYVSAVNGGLGERWATATMTPPIEDDFREVTSAPVEGTRSRVQQPAPSIRPSTAEGTVNHPKTSSLHSNTFTPSLSKQSSGYVSQETLPALEPVVMSPKKLVPQSQEPLSILSPTHRASMV
ncbi:cytokine receptor-like isoform X3 [Oratosquilla oratoria]|uniref:cytokine receptor-like isoform X3 n=1 Tax=Oratosquilla oratoria TaxID=337810 RepID=UPI003F770CA3